MKIRISIILIALALVSCKKDDQSTSNDTSGNKFNSGYVVVKYKNGNQNKTDTIRTFEYIGLDFPFKKDNFDGSYRNSILSNILRVKLHPSIVKGDYNNPKPNTNLTASGDYFINFSILATGPAFIASSGKLVINDATTQTIQLYEGVNAPTKQYLVVNGVWEGLFKNTSNSTTHNAQIYFVNATFEN
jgi:hypothetical protein